MYWLVSMGWGGMCRVLVMLLSCIPRIVFSQFVLRMVDIVAGTMSRLTDNEHVLRWV